LLTTGVVVHGTEHFRSANGAERNDHPRPWLKIVVYHAITVAARLTA